MKYGYARVSTKGQKLASQLDSLRKAGCEKIFREKRSAIKQRPVLNALLSRLQRGDVLVVWKLDRLGRSVQHLVRVVQDLDDRGIGFHSISDSIDTRSPSGRLMFHILAAIAEFERSLIAERTHAGIEAARRRGKRIGRPPSLNASQIATARAMAESGAFTPEAIAASFDVGKTTLWRALSAAA